MEKTTIKYVPFATRGRLATYYKVFCALRNKNQQAITSSELSAMIKVDSATIRRDFSMIGKLGKKGQGYDVLEIIRVFNEQFKLSESEGIIIVGLGHLGSAVVKYYQLQPSFTYISQVFEVDENLINKSFLGLKILDYKQITALLDKDVTMAILTVPGNVAQETLDQLVKLGIKGFINFTGTKLFCEDDSIIIKEIDITQQIQSLMYDLKSNF
ncbi:MAG: redox-sensing transcriptional repressor Rex [Bacilli bacterium]